MNQQTEQTLQGKRILLTRSAEHNADTRPMFEQRGAEVLCFPSIEIHDPPTWQEVDNAIWKLAEYTDVCFTSQYAVKKLIERARHVRPQALSTLSTRSLITVGEKTRLTLESLGFKVSHTPVSSSAQEVVKLLSTQNLSGRKFLYPKGSIARDELPHFLRSLQVPVDEVTVYHTLLPKDVDTTSLVQKLKRCEIDIVTFFSPSAVFNCVELFGVDALSKTTIAVIGRTTADAVIKSGLNPTIVAEQATSENLCSMIELYFQHHHG